MSNKLENPENYFLEYLPLTGDCSKRLKRCLAIMETLWTNGALSYSGIRRIILEVYGDNISDKVLSQLLEFLKNKGLIVDVNVRFGKKYKRFYAITGQGARLITSIALSSYIDKVILREFFPDNEFYDYIKSILYSYYLERKLYVLGDIAEIIIDNLEGLERIAEITNKCVGLDEAYEVKKCLEAEFKENTDKDKIRDVVKRFAELIHKKTWHDKWLVGECAEKIDGLIIHITEKDNNKVEIYSGYYYRWNPLYEVAIIFTHNNIKFEKCSRILYVKGNRKYVNYALHLLINMKKNRLLNQFFVEEILSDYIDAELISPYSDYDPGVDIQPKNVIIVIDTSKSERMTFDLTEIDELIRNNIVILAKNPVEVKMGEVRNLTLVYHVQTPTKVEDDSMLKISIEGRYIRSFRGIMRIDLFIIYMKPLKDIEFAMPRLKLRNISVSPLSPPRTIVVHKNSSSTYNLEINCSNDVYSFEAMIDKIISDPSKAYSFVNKFLEEVIKKNMNLFPLCLLGNEELTHYKSTSNDHEVNSKGPIIQISRDQVIGDNILHMITSYVIMHGG